MLFRLCALILSCLCLSACATTSHYNHIVHSWIGKPIEQFVTVWGYPDNSFTTVNHEHVYVYQANYLAHFPATQIGGTTSVSQDNGKIIINQTPPTYIGGQTIQYSCTTWVKFNKQKIIDQITFRGNNCVATEDQVNTLSAP